MIDKIIKKFNDNVILITIVSIYNKISILNNKSKLQKYDQMSGLIILDSPQLFEKNYDEELVKKYKDNSLKQLEKFVDRMKENISEKNLVRMYNNLSTLRVEEKNLYLLRHGAGGSYSIKDNKMIVYSDDFYRVIREKFGSMMSDVSLEGIYSHELLHMSSSSKKNGKWCCGFHHYYASFFKCTLFSIAMGINEGYTDLLNERIFNIKNSGGRYEFFKETARFVEDIIGQEKMEELFFSNNLNGLIKELSLYVSEKNTTDFILNLDSMINDIEVAPRILKYLVTLCDSKIKKNLREGTIDNKIALFLYDDLKNRIYMMISIINEVIKKIDGDIEKNSLGIDINSILNENILCNSKNR